MRRQSPGPVGSGGAGGAGGAAPPPPSPPCKLDAGCPNARCPHALRDRPCVLVSGWRPGRGGGGGGGRAAQATPSAIARVPEQRLILRWGGGGGGAGLYDPPSSRPPFCSFLNQVMGDYPDSGRALLGIGWGPPDKGGGETGSDDFIHFARHRKAGACLRCTWGKNMHTWAPKLPCITLEWSMCSNTPPAPRPGCGFCTDISRVHQDHYYCISCVACTSLKLAHVDIDLYDLERHHVSNGHRRK